MTFELMDLAPELNDAIKFRDTKLIWQLSMACSQWSPIKCSLNFILSKSVLCVLVDTY